MTCLHKLELHFISSSIYINIIIFFSPKICSKASRITVLSDSKTANTTNVYSKKSEACYIPSPHTTGRLNSLLQTVKLQALVLSLVTDASPGEQVELS